MKVWMCADGSYSDYEVRAIYSTKELAQTATKRFDWSNDPVEFELDEVKIPDTVPYFAWRFNEIVHTSRRSEVCDRNVVKSDYTGTLEVLVMAEDAEHARKIAIDLFTQYEAKKAGLC